MADTEEDKHKREIESAVQRSQILSELAHLKSSIESDLKGLKHTVDHIEEKLAQNYVTQVEFASVKDGHVTQSEFDPVKRVVYGLVALILTSVIVALVTLVLRK